MKSSPLADTPVVPRTGAQQVASAPARQAAQESQARAYTHRVRAELDVTTLDAFEVQMPDGMQPTVSRSGQNRKFVWTFPDSSRIEATFRPIGGEGSERGLALYMVNVKD